MAKNNGKDTTRDPLHDKLDKLLARRRELIDRAELVVTELAEQDPLEEGAVAIISGLSTEQVGLKRLLAVLAGEIGDTQKRVEAADSFATKARRAELRGRRETFDKDMIRRALELVEIGGQRETVARELELLGDHTSDGWPRRMTRTLRLQLRGVEYSAPTLFGRPSRMAQAFERQRIGHKVSMVNAKKHKRNWIKAHPREDLPEHFDLHIAQIERAMALTAERGKVTA